MAAHDDQALVDVVERLRNRFFGKYRGVVTDVDAGTLRIKAHVPAVLAGQATGWARACVPFAGSNMGIAFLPAVGAGVWIEFEGGDASYPIWTGCFWFDGQQPSDATGSTRVILTASGLKILFDDSTTTIKIEDSQNTVKLGSDGITLERGSSQIAISDAEVNVNNGALEVV